MADGEGTRTPARRRRLALGAAAGAGLLALLATTLAVVALVGDDAAPREAWRAEGADPAHDGDADLAMWLHDGVVARVAATGTGDVAGHDTADGGELWRTPPPEAGARPCAASERTNAEGVGAVLYLSRENESCSVLSVIDTRHGETLWTRDLASSLGLDPAEGQIVATVHERAVTVAFGAAAEPGSFHRLDLATGDARPLPGLDPRDAGLHVACRDGSSPAYIHVTASRVVAMGSCAAAAEETRYATRVYDANSGETLWHRTADDSAVVADAVADDPLVLREGSAFVAYSDAGERLWEFDERDDDGGRLTARGVVDGVLVMERHVGDPEYTGKPVVFAGYDLGDGGRLWRSVLPAETQILGLDGAGGAALLGRYTSEGGDPGDGDMELTWLDAADGAERAGGAVPFRFDSGGYAVAVAVFDRDRFYLGNGGLEPESVLRAFDR